METWAHFSSHTWGGGVTFLMAMAAWQFVQDEKGAGNEIAYGVARWWIQMVLPLGFASIALRLVWHAGPHWKYRILSAAGILAMGMLVSRQGLDPEQWLIPGIVLLLGATLLGAPLYTALGGATLLYLWREASPLSGMATSQYPFSTEALIPTIPLFTLAGYFMAESQFQAPGASFPSHGGSIPCGPGHGDFIGLRLFYRLHRRLRSHHPCSGSTLASSLVGGSVWRKPSLGLITGAGALGILFPPSLPIILYFIVANANVPTGLRLEHMFLGGLMPGLLMLVVLAFYSRRLDFKNHFVGRQFNFRNLAILMGGQVGARHPGCCVGGSVQRMVQSTPVAAAR